MTNYTLTVLDTSGIQHYLFGTNNLKQNAGASYLADCATRKWVQVIFEDLVPGLHNVLDFDDVNKPLDLARTINDGQTQAEVIYAGGGNTAILFKDLTIAKTFAAKLSRKVIIEAPDLQLVLAHQEFNWHTDVLGSKTGVVQSVMEQLRLHKQQMPPAQPLRGLGVTVDCAFTYRPAVGYDRQDRPVSAESWAKQRAERAAEQRLLNFLADSSDITKYSIPRDFEEIGGSHEDSSYIAIVHADGNGMGKRIEAIQENFANAAQNDAYVQAMRTLSSSVQQAAHKGLNETIQYLMANIKPTTIADSDGHQIFAIGEQIELKNNKDRSDDNWGKPFLPFRPIVFGGDDVTFVCEGRLGLQLAAYYLDSFTAQKLSDGKQAYCRAGVAVTHAHYPFALAYELAEELCQSAKTALKEWEKDPLHRETGITAFDWHFAVNGMNEDLNTTRERNYQSADGTLLMRPLRLTETRLDWRNWSQFKSIIEDFQRDWLAQRGKLVGLREPLRRGADAVKQYRHFNALDALPTIKGQRQMATSGWQSQRCGYFDAIEALDFYGILASTAPASESEAR